MVKTATLLVVGILCSSAVLTSGNDGQWGRVDDVTGDLHLMPNSPCVDAGLDALAVDPQGNPLVIDRDGGPRIIGAAVDIGAHEYKP